MHQAHPDGGGIWLVQGQVKAHDAPAKDVDRHGDPTAPDIAAVDIIYDADIDRRMVDLPYGVRAVRSGESTGHCFELLAGLLPLAGGQALAF